MSTRIEVVVSDRGHLILEIERSLLDYEIKEIYRDAIKRLGALAPSVENTPSRPYGCGAGTSLYTDLEAQEE